MVKLKHHTFESHCAAVDQSCIINMDCHGGRPTHTQFSEVKDEEYSCNVVMMEAYGKGPSNKELNIRSLELECQKQEPCAGAAADNCATRKPLQKQGIAFESNAIIHTNRCVLFRFNISSRSWDHRLYPVRLTEGPRTPAAFTRGTQAARLKGRPQTPPVSRQKPELPFKVH
ncbi:hypothetical protein Anapl_00911 [Anas platyrhynchos]|uniref:Uncharacterized protein n=1 Tax=Anas platyrhynchos TaxID=8839 RepID=R0JYU4_ANAPL|nr:hypothetical protein Anapl_00911 [Anas platyrhynchos]